MHRRQKKILEMLQGGKLDTKEAAKRFQVTEMTLRRDLKALEEMKLILPVKGGAILHPSRYEPEELSRQVNDTKFALALALSRAVLPAKSIFISSGSTMLAFAKLLAQRSVIPETVVTNSLMIASALFQAKCRLILLGGELRSTSMDLVGPLSEENISKYPVEWLLSGCDSADSTYGFYTADSTLSKLERGSIHIAAQVAIVTESVKFTRHAPTCFARISDVKLLVTDSGLSQEDQEKLGNFPIEVIQTEPPEPLNASPETPPERN